MAANVFVNESEMVMATHQLRRKIAYLREASEQYFSLMTNLDGIVQDQLITAAMQSLAASVKEVVSVLDGLDGALGAELSTYFSELEQANTFRYPDSVFDQIKAILSVFL